MKLSGLLLSLFWISSSVLAGEDYYQLLGLDRDADSKAIRKAFKKLALKHHPDKNPGESHDFFLKLNRAYETLKDPDKRKRYDSFGDEEDKDEGSGKTWKSYEYYTDFGIYDNDELVITLDFADFRKSVSETYDYWFINFYNPQCGHCQELAPIWRRLSKKLEGVIRIGAVNCQDAPILCQNEGIGGYPTLIFYSPHERRGRRYRSAREEEFLMEFILSELPHNAVELKHRNFQKIVERQQSDRPWVVLYCGVECPEHEEQIILNRMLEGIANIGHVDCAKESKLCENTGVFHYKDSDDLIKGKGVEIDTSNYEEIARIVITKLPKPKNLDTKFFRNILSDIEERGKSPWLIHFVFGDDGLTLEEDKKMSSLLLKAKMGYVDCQVETSVCSEFQIRHPIYALFKPGGNYELNYGRDKTPDVLNFVRTAIAARTMTTITGSRLDALFKKADTQVFVDFFSPHCPPCLNMLPEFRKASAIVGGSIQFVTVDCTKNPSICNKFNIRTYPTTIYFNGSRSNMHPYHGSHRDQEIADFVLDILRPSVVTINEKMFNDILKFSPNVKTLVIDFYANWCGPCMRMTPEWNKLGRMFSKIPTVMIAKVDCVVEEDFCRRVAVTGYPSIRLYLERNRYYVYNGHREAYALRDWIWRYMHTIADELDDYSIYNVIKQSDHTPVLIDFYAPWCGPCQRLSPKFEEAALTLKSKGVRCAKMNCDFYRQICQEFKIRAYPTLLFYQNGWAEELETTFHSDAIVQEVESLLENKHSFHDEL